jgi:hypothetical protein
MLYKHGFMLIRVVLAVNDFIFWAGFSEKSSGGKQRTRRWAGRNMRASTPDRAGLGNCVILAWTS